MSRLQTRFADLKEQNRAALAASIDPSDDQGALPLTSDATTSSCRNPRIAVATSEAVRTRRSTGWMPAPDHTQAVVKRIPTIAMIARYEA